VTSNSRPLTISLEPALQTGQTGNGIGDSIVRSAAHGLQRIRNGVRSTINFDPPASVPLVATSHANSNS